MNDTQRGQASHEHEPEHEPEPEHEHEHEHEPEPEPEPEHEHEPEPEQRTSVTIRRAPKLSVFAVVGALIGFLAALVLTGMFEVDPAVGFSATLGYLCLYAMPLGVVLGIVVALLLDGRASRRSAEVIAGKLEVHSAGNASDDAGGDEIESHSSS